MALRIIEVQQKLDDAGQMTVTLMTNRRGAGEGRMVLCERRADTYEGLGVKLEKPIRWNTALGSADFSAKELAVFTGELYVVIDGGKDGGHDLSNVCCIFLGAPALHAYRVTEANLLLYPDRSKRDTRLAKELHCAFAPGETAAAPPLGWSMPLEPYGLAEKESLSIELSFYHLDAQANTPVFGPACRQTLSIAPPKIVGVYCGAQNGQSPARLTATVKGDAPPEKLRAVLLSDGQAIAEHTLTRSKDGDYVWEALPTLAPGGRYGVLFHAECPPGRSGATHVFPLLTEPPEVVECAFTADGVALTMAREGVYEVRVGGGEPAVHVGRVVALRPAPKDEPSVRLTREGSFGPAVSCVLSRPAYYRSVRSGGGASSAFYRYATRPGDDWGDWKRTVDTELPTYGGAYFSAAGKELSVKAATFAPDADLDAVHRDYTALLAACGAANQIKAVRAAVCTGLPMRVGEMLFYHYHHRPDCGCCDLWPGMGLWVEYAGYQFIPADLRGVLKAYNDDLNGYVGAGSALYPLVERGGKLRFEPFASAAADSGWFAVPPPGEIQDDNALCGGAGVLDLLFAGLKAPLCRLAYPQTISPRDEAGSLKFYENVCLFAADTTALLDKAVERMQRSAYEEGRLASFVQGVGVTAFRGRAAAVPKLRVTVDGAAEWVSVGTTLGDLARRSGAAQGALWRCGPAGLCPVLGAGNDMPLLMGDRVDLS